MTDVGYDALEVGDVTLDNRLYAVGRRRRHVDMRRDGLSIRSLR
jgi:hypothetical protein